MTAVILFVITSLLGYQTNFAFWESRDGILYEGESVYNYLRVQDTPMETILSTNVLFGVQSLLEKTNRLTGMYYDYALAAPYMVQNPKDVLILGMGSGTYAHQLNKYMPGLNISGAEIDGKITDLAHKYFALPETIPVSEYDGRAYLNETDDTYDVIMVDAYQDITIPFQMSSVEFFNSVKTHLKPGGVMIVNLNMHGTRQGGFAGRLSDTIAFVFSNVMTVGVPGNTNRELFASDQDMSALMKSSISTIQDSQLKKFMRQTSSQMSVYHSSGHLLTDNKAPVELLGMKELDDIIREQVQPYRDIYIEEGLQGLLRSF